jgi:predicted dehydrogenase
VRPYGLGVAGAGWLGESLIKDAIPSGEFQVVAVQDVVPGRAAEVAERYAVGWAGERFEDLLDAPSVDAVLICTPNSLHAAQAQAALAANKHVLVQKPMALSQADADATIAAAQHAQKLLFVDYSYRFLDTVVSLRDRLAGVGAISFAAAEFHNIYGPGTEKAWFFNRRMSGGGALIDLGVHLLDMALWLLEPAQVMLRSAALSGDQAIEHAAALRVDLDNTPFQLDVSWNAPLPLTRIGFEVVGANGTVRWENVDGSFFHFRTLVNGTTVAERETTLREDTLRAFAAALRDGHAPPIDTRVYALLEQAYAAGAN